MTKYIRTSILAGAIASILLATSCEHPAKPPTTTDDKSGFTLSFNGMFDGAPIVYKTGEYEVNNLEMVRFTNMALILSHVSLVKTNDEKVQLGDGYLFVDFVGGKTSTHFENIPFGDYKGISFQLGLDSAINHGDPSQWPATHPLSTSTGLHWGWAGGYIFQALDGTWKTDSSATTWNGLSLHTVGDNYVAQKFLPYTFSISNTNGMTGQIDLDAVKYFKGTYNIVFAADGSFSHSVGSNEVTLMNKVVANSEKVFKVRSVK
jgi:hypothetical protein